jgi:hypothetical protein
MSDFRSYERPLEPYSQDDDIEQWMRVLEWEETNREELSGILSLIWDRYKIKDGTIFLPEDVEERMMYILFSHTKEECEPSYPFKRGNETRSRCKICGLHYTFEENKNDE